MDFKDHFSAHAAAYAQARPGYPLELFAWLSAQCRGHALAWDAGCGNGQASVALAEHFDAVYASDPSATQIASAPPHGKVRYAVEPAEQCALADGSADLVTVAQAYHWFDAARFCAEANRVLAPDAVIAVWTYAESRVDAAVDRVFDDFHNEQLADDWPAGREHVINGYRNLPFDFAPITVPAFAMRCDWTLAQYLDYLRSWSASQRYQQRTGCDAVDLISEAMAKAWGNQSKARTVSWPLTILAGRRLRDR
ncbi:MAG: class I SAM-dependent methyltransferase [Arenimonas sp.]